MTLLIGSTGYIGSAFVKRFLDIGEKFRIMSYADVLATKFKSHFEGIDSVINASGYTGKPNVDKCEEEKDKCILGNVIIPMKIVDQCKELNIPYGHVSSGCIFTGRRSDGTAFDEYDEPNFSFKYNNCSFYSGTKAMTEDIVKQYDKSYIWRLRIPFDDEDGPRNYISKLLKYDKLIDYENSITHRREYVNACVEMLERKVPFGIYNVVNTNPITTKRVTELINKYLYPNKEFKFFDSEDDFYKTAAKTPRSNCVLDNRKLFRLNIPINDSEYMIKYSLQHWKI